MLLFAQYVPRAVEENNAGDLLSSSDGYFKCRLDEVIHARGILIKSQHRGMFSLTHSLARFISLPFSFLLALSVLHPTHPPPLYLTSFLSHFSLSVRELKHRATQQPNEPKFQIHDYIESQKHKSGCCSLV